MKVKLFESFLIFIKVQYSIKSLKPTGYTSLQTTPSLVQIMACRLLGAKRLSEQKTVHYQMNQWKYISIKNTTFTGKNRFENAVCKTRSHFIWLQCVKACHIFCQHNMNMSEPCFMSNSSRLGRGLQCELRQVHCSLRLGWSICRMIL